MSNFPLYDTLYNDTKELLGDLPKKEKDEFIKLVKNIDENGQELIYVLIRSFQLENSEDNTTFKLPYNGKYVKDTDIDFDFDTLPIQLKHILLRFVRMHTKTMKEVANELQETTNVL